MVSTLQSMVDAVERLDFTYCDVAHESPKSDSNGLVLLPRSYLPECPVEIQMNRPACPHAQFQRQDREMTDPMLDLAYALLQYQIEARASIQEALNHYDNDCEKLKRIDELMLIERYKKTKHLSSIDVINNQPQVMELTQAHRAIVDRMRAFRDLLVTEAKRILAEQANIDAHVVASSS